MISIKESIMDAFDDVMMSYMQSDEYIELDSNLIDHVARFREQLSPEQAHEFNSILNEMSMLHSKVASEALYRGTVHGIEISNNIR
jgi:hypothetical protein